MKEDFFIVYACASLFAFFFLWICFVGANPNMKALVHDTIEVVLPWYKMQAEFSIPLYLRTYILFVAMWVPILLGFWKANGRQMRFVPFLAGLWICSCILIHIFFNGFFSLPDASEWKPLPIVFLLWLLFLGMFGIGHFSYIKAIGGFRNEFKKKLVV